MQRILERKCNVDAISHNKTLTWTYTTTADEDDRRQSTYDRL